MLVALFVVMWITAGFIGYVMGKGYITIPKKLTPEELKIETARKHEEVERMKIENEAQKVLLNYGNGGLF